jgi:hypothetical protein
MIRIARLESATNGPGPAAPEYSRGAWADGARKELLHGARLVEQWVGQRPGLCLGAAFLLGATWGWWLKRR